jgi:hypothetical protein
MLILIKKCGNDSTKMTMFLKPFSWRVICDSKPRQRKIKCGNGPRW